MCVYYEYAFNVIHVANANEINQKKFKIDKLCRHIIIFTQCVRVWCRANTNEIIMTTHICLFIMKKKKNAKKTIDIR